ncbi:hypothetical protein A13Y_00617 [Escherichia coli KTE194]|nr:hypothetical protein A13Y_00617 [Escherichia coli KTE194]ELI30265.1 hypothetical protein WIE_00493 [Escherichia coli KTE113]
MSDMSEASVFPVEPESGTPGRQYRLALRGNSLNPMIDAATPLLGMVMRLSTMNSQAMPEHLFAQVVTDVQAVEQLLQEQGMDKRIRRIRGSGWRANAPGNGNRRHPACPLRQKHDRRRP